MFSCRNQSIGCAVAWVTIARDSEPEYPFHPVGKCYRVRAGHLFSPFLKVGRLYDNCFLNHYSVFIDGCDWTNVGHAVCLLKIVLIDSNLPVTCWHPCSFIVVLTAPKTSNFDLIWFTHFHANINIYCFTKVMENPGFFIYCGKAPQFTPLLLWSSNWPPYLKLLCPWHTTYARKV